MAADDPVAAPAADVLEPGVRAFVDGVAREAGRRGGFAGLTPSQARRLAEEVRAPWRAGGPTMASITERLAPGGLPVRVRFYDPTGPSGDERRRGALVYLHGGGWTMFSLDTHDRVMREYAARSALVVIGVDYSLSPEARFPKAHDEVVEVMRWLAREGESLGLDASRLAIGGDSAGANLALSASLSLRDQAKPAPPRAMLLNYGCYDLAISEAAVRRCGGPELMLTAEEMESFWRGYLRGPQDARDPLASPLLADLAGLPPAFLAIAECDILAEQSLAMAQRLEAAGVRVRSVVYAGAAHSFLEAVAISPLSARALQEASQWLREVCA